MDICSSQHSPVHRVGMHGISNRDTHSYPMHNNLSVHLTKITMRWTASKLVSEVSAPFCTNGVWPLRQIVSETQKIKPLTMFPSNVQSVDLPMNRTTWRFWMMRKSIGCSTLAARSSASKQWAERTDSNDDDNEAACACVL